MSFCVDQFQSKQEHKKKALYLEEEKEEGQKEKPVKYLASYRGHYKVMKEQEVLVPKVFQFREAVISCKVPLYRFL